MRETRTIGGTRYRLYGVLPRPVALSFEVLLRERGIPAYLEDLAPEARPYAGVEPMGERVYFWVPEVAFEEVREVLGDAGDAGA